MRLFTRSAAVLALAGTSSMAAAQAPSKCLTEPEAAALFEYAMPELLDSVAKKCGPALPSQAFLSTQATQLVTRYRASAASKWPTAKAAMIKAAGGEAEKTDKIFNALPDDTLKSLLTAGLATAITGDIQAAKCSRIDKLTAALAPLPPSNVSQIIVQIVALESEKKKSSKLMICQG
jgi:hypothetical protein